MLQVSDYSTGPGPENKSRNLSTHVSFRELLWSPLFKALRDGPAFSCNPPESIVMVCAATGARMNPHPLLPIFSHKLPFHGNWRQNDLKGSECVGSSLEARLSWQKTVGYFRLWLYLFVYSSGVDLAMANKLYRGSIS